MNFRLVSIRIISASLQVFSVMLTTFFGKPLTEWRVARLTPSDTLGKATQSNGMKAICLEHIKNDLRQRFDFDCRKSHLKLAFALAGIILCSATSSFAKLVAKHKPILWKTVATLNLGKGTVLSPNRESKLIRAELLDEDFLKLIGKAHGLSVRELSSIRLVDEPKETWISFYQVGASIKVYDLMSKALRRYISNRQNGHSKAFLIAALKHSVGGKKILDPDLKMLIDNHPYLPPEWLKKRRAGIINDIRWVAYTAVDGDIAWEYYLSFKPNGSFDFVSESKFDPKEIDPEFEKVIQGVEETVTQKMKNDGSFGSLGSCHVFWTLKKDRLKQKGILWRSPSELNPGVDYD